MRSGARKVRLAFTAPSLAHFAGVYLFHQFLQRLRFRSHLSLELRYPQRNNRYTLSEMILALICPMILGLEKIDVSSLLKTNGVFQYLTGLPSFPDPQTLRRFLVRSPPDLLPLLFEVHDDLRKYFIVQPSSRSACWLDFDSTANTIYGHQEGAMKGYNPGHPGKRSYHPLVVSEAHLKDCLGGFLRYGNAHTAERAVPLLQTALSLLPVTRNVRTRADSGFYEKHFVAELDAQAEHGIFSTAEFSYQPQGWKKPYRFVVLRRKVENDPDSEK